MTASNEKHERLKTILQGYESVLVAFSGGCDSALLSKAARLELGRNAVLAVTAKSPSLAQNEIREVDDFTRRHDIPHEWIETRELENSNYAANPANRCYFCKSELYGRLEPLRLRRGLRCIASGTNIEDLGDWRPGLGAARERGVKNPLVEAGLLKAEIREISKQLGLETWDKPAAACLSSRIPYGQAVTREKLRQIDQGEGLLKAEGFRVVRLRHYGERAVIEVGPEEKSRLENSMLRRVVFEKISALGFSSVEVDPEGYRSGKLNPPHFLSGQP